MTLWQYPVFLEEEFCAQNPEDCFTSYGVGDDPWGAIIFAVLIVVYILIKTK